MSQSILVVLAVTVLHCGPNLQYTFLWGTFHFKPKFHARARTTSPTQSQPKLFKTAILGLLLVLFSKPPMKTWPCSALPASPSWLAHSFLMWSPSMLCFYSLWTQTRSRTIIISMPSYLSTEDENSTGWLNPVLPNRDVFYKGNDHFKIWNKPDGLTGH